MGKVALFIPCFVDQLSPQVGLDMVRVLERIGCQVEFPEGQTCCGQPAFNTGYWEDARAVAERFVRVFADAETIVCPSGSCAAMVRCSYPELLATSPLREQASKLGQLVYEFSDYVANVARISDVGATFAHRVTIHDSCHGLRELHLKKAARELLKNVRGLELVEMPYCEECCGFGGTFATKFGMISAAMGDTKAVNIEASGAEYVTGTDSSCLLHLEGILRLKQSKARTIHLASILARTDAAEELGAPAAPGAVRR